MSRRQRRHGPLLSERGVALILYALTLALLALTVAQCLRS